MQIGFLGLEMGDLGAERLHLQVAEARPSEAMLALVSSRVLGATKKRDRLHIREDVDGVLLAGTVFLDDQIAEARRWNCSFARVSHR